MSHDTGPRTELREGEPVSGLSATATAYVALQREHVALKERCERQAETIAKLQGGVDTYEAIARGLGKLRREMAEMAERAADEIRQLRAQRDALQPVADAYRILERVIAMATPGRSLGSEHDWSWSLAQRAKELRAMLAAEVEAEKANRAAAAGDATAERAARSAKELAAARERSQEKGRPDDERAYARAVRAPGGDERPGYDGSD